MTVKKWKHSGTKKHSMSDREIRNGLLSEKVYTAPVRERQ